MTDEIESLLGGRKIVAIPADPDGAEQHLARARTTLEQARLLTDAALQERLRYEAGLHLALALMAADGYRLRSGPGHHESAVAYLRARLGRDPGLKAAVRVLDMTRRNRNSELYRAVEVGAAAAEASAAAVAVLLRAVAIELEALSGRTTERQ